MTIIVINLDSEQKTKVIQIRDQASIQAEEWLFDQTHQGKTSEW